MTALAELNPHAARSPSRAWRNAIAIGCLIVTSPVALLVLALVAVSVLPMLILALPLAAAAWAPAVRWAPVSATGPRPLRPAAITG